MLRDIHGTVLRYVCAHPGTTVQEVARATGLARERVRRTLETLYANRLLGRQNSMADFLAARWFPEADALRRYELKTGVEE